MSFSLPSASGVVSLLNDAKHARPDCGSLTTDSMTGVETRPDYYQRDSSGSSSSVSSKSSGSLSNSIQSRDGIGTSHDSLSSNPTSCTDSSTDSLESTRVAEVHALRQQLKLEGQQKGRGSTQVQRASSESVFEDGSREMERRAGGQRGMARSVTDGDNNILHQSKLAASPKPIRGSQSSNDRAEDVPLSMRKATSRNGDDGVESSPDVDKGSAPREAGLSLPVSGKRRYPCSHAGCDKTFSTSGHAARHNRIHTGSKPYRCTFPGCNASFSRQDNSLQHYRTHVLHPKSRSTTASSSLPEPGSSGEGGSRQLVASMNNHLQSLDAETEATVRMGRKALEEGTAIAVVHEVVDRDGRKGEAVQRMVGQPKANRPVSSSMQSGYKDHDSNFRGQGNDMDEEEDGLSVGTSWSNTATGSSSNGPHQYASPMPPADVPSDRLEHSRIYAHQPSAYGPAYAPGSSPPARSGSYLSTASSYRPYSLSQHVGSTTRPQPIVHEYQVFNGAPGYERTRRGSSNSLRYGHPYADPARAPKGHHFYSTTHSPTGHARKLSASLYDHKRSLSFGGEQTLHPRIKGEGESEQRGEEDSSALLSASLSPVTPPSRRAENESHARQSGSERALSLLPPTPSSGRGNATGSLAPLNSANLDSHFAFHGIRMRPGTTDMHLPLPSISKLPYSNDRSTTALAPTNPLDDLLMHSGGIPSGKFEQNGRTLPPLRDVRGRQS